MRGQCQVLEERRAAMEERLSTFTGQARGPSLCRRRGMGAKAARRGPAQPPPPGPP